VRTSAEILGEMNAGLTVEGAPFLDNRAASVPERWYAIYTCANH